MEKLFEPFIGNDYSEIKSLDFENMFFSHISKFGNVKRQYRVPSNGCGYTGKIDFVALIEGKKVGIEIDWKTPRKKSIFKLENLEADECYAVIRSPFKFYKVK